VRHLRPSKWGWSALAALPTSVFVLALFYYWFGVVNRHVIFLYDHVAVGIPRAQPFDAMTSSRYWMAGLVAAGAVMVLYAGANWSIGRISTRSRKHFVTSPWWRVWMLTAIPLVIGIPAITMTANTPTLPPRLAAACTVATLLGLAVALAAGEWAANRPLDLAWLTVDGAGLVPVLTLLKAIELPGRGLSISDTAARLVAIGSIVVGLVWLAGMSWLRARRRRETPGAFALLVSGLGLSYLLLPLVHHLLATPPGYRYITNAGNFLAFSPGVQLLALAAAAALALGTTSTRRRLGQPAVP